MWRIWRKKFNRNFHHINHIFFKLREIKNLKIDKENKKKITRLKSLKARKIFKNHLKKEKINLSDRGMKGLKENLKPNSDTENKERIINLYNINNENI